MPFFSFFLFFFFQGGKIYPTHTLLTILSYTRRCPETTRFIYTSLLPYYPGPAQIQTVLQQGELFAKQDQLFSVVAMGPSSLLTVDLEVETSVAVPNLMVKKLVNDALEHLANNLKNRAEQLKPLDDSQN